jgi:uncharacterized protein YjbI with pentapeptide repeats
MMGIFSFLRASEPTPPGVIIRNVLGEEIDRVEGVWDLVNADLRGRQWQHANLSGLCLDGAHCEGINLFGARLVRTSFCRANLRNAELSFSDATGANFRDANLDACLMYRSETRLAHFDHAVLSEQSDIPGMRRICA